MVAVLPIPHQLESCSQGQSGETWHSVFIRILGDDVFSLIEIELLGIQAHRLFAFADEVHFDSAMGHVVWGTMKKCREVEIRSEFPISAGQDAKIELCRYPFSVIISELQGPLRFS